MAGTLNKESENYIMDMTLYALLMKKIKEINDIVSTIPNPLVYRGSIANIDELPASPKVGDMYNIETKSIYGEPGMNVAWNGDNWDTLGAAIDMSNFYTKTESDVKFGYLAPEILDATGDTISWDVSTSDNASVTLTETKAISITNGQEGKVISISCYGGTLDFSDTTQYNKSTVLSYLQPIVEYEHITYTLIYNNGKWDVTACIFAGGSANV